MGEALDAATIIVRYASGSQVDGDVIDGSAFRPRPVDNGMLSVNRFGVFAADPAEDIKAIRSVAAEWMTIRKTGRFAEIVGEAIAECLAEGGHAFALEADERALDGKPDDPSHALVHGIPGGDDGSAVAIRDMIALRIQKLHPGKID